VVELQRLRPDHEPAVLAFEQANRAYFAESISDRGDEFYEQFAERHRALLADPQAGVGAYYVLVAEAARVVGRFNLYDVVDGTAVVGYRVAERVAGRGVATSALQDLCRIASEQYRLQTLRAATSSENVASQRVLIKVGFVVTGPAEVGGRQGSWYELELARLRWLLSSLVFGAAAEHLDRRLHAWGEALLPASPGLFSTEFGDGRAQSV
jgi:ribosomal-protein-alanine N-acetyltransferase